MKPDLVNQQMMFQYYPGKFLENETTISPNDALSIRNDLIGGLNFCDKGFGPDTNGECVRVYKLEPAKNDRGIEEREIEKSKRPKDLKKYLQLLYSFDF